MDTDTSCHQYFVLAMRTKTNTESLEAGMYLYLCSDVYMCLMVQEVQVIFLVVYVYYL